MMDAVMDAAPRHPRERTGCTDEFCEGNGAHKSRSEGGFDRRATSAVKSMSDGRSLGCGVLKY